MFLVLAIVLLASYFFTDAIPLWAWVLLIAANLWWILCEPIERFIDSYRHHEAPKH
jgi:hypothetical protein